MKPRLDIVGFSGGIVSAVTGSLVAAEHPGTTVLLFHDPGEEDADNARFSVEVSAYLGIPITNDSDGRTVSQLFDDKGMLGNNLMTPCSRILKQDRSRAFCERSKQEYGRVTLYIGFSVDEQGRLTNMRQRYDSIGIEVRAPVMERGWTHTDCLRIVTQEWRIKQPRAYDHYDNANCKGCVKGGLAYWGQVYLNDRDAWDLRADQEDEYRHTILHSRYGGYPDGSLRNMLPLCLKNAERWRANRRTSEAFKLIDSPCGCGE